MAQLKNEDKPKTPLESVNGQGQVKADKSDYTLEILEDYDKEADAFKIPNEDPNYAYRFLNIQTQNISRKTGNLLYDKGGWQICPREHLKKIGIKDSFISADGTYRVGDVVLAFMPRRLYEKKEEHKRKRAQEPMDAVQRLLKKGDSSLAGTGHENMKGIQTQKDLGM